MKSQRILGKLYNYKNINDLSLQITPNQSEFKRRREMTRKLLQITNRKNIVHNIETGEIKEIDMKNNPLLLREFIGVPVFTKRMRRGLIADITNDGNIETILNNKVLQILPKNKPLSIDDNMNVKYEMSFRVIISGQDGSLKTGSRRKMQGSYIGDIGKYVKHLVIREGGTADGYLNNFNEKMFKNAKWKADVIQIDNIGPFLEAIVNELMHHYQWVTYIIIESIKTITKNKNVLDLSTMLLKKVSYDNIKINLFNNVIDIKMKDNENCVINYLKKKYCKINIVKYFSDIEEIDTNIIIGFCKKYRIKCIAYDIECNLIAEHIPPKPSKSYKSLVYIAYNNHIYPLTNKYLSKVERREYETFENMSIINLNAEFKKLLKKNIIPCDIRLYDIEKMSLKSFIHDKKLYFSNDDYDDCLDILAPYGLTDKMTPYITRYNVMSIIEQLYTTDTNSNTYSFFPQLKNVAVNAFFYDRYDEIIKDIKGNKEKGVKKIMDNSTTIDKNKAYPSALYRLSFIHTFDIRSGVINVNPKTINKYNLYYVKPKESTILIPYTMFCDGEHLLYCKSQGQSFELLKEYVCNKTQNFFKSMVEEYYEKSKEIKNKKLVKDCMNFFIGKMTLGCDTIKEYVSSSVTKICNNDEATFTDGYLIQYDDDYQFKMQQSTQYKIYTRKLLDFQIKNMSRRAIYEKMLELNLTTEDIIQINVDALTFKGTRKMKNIDRKDFKKWHVLDTPNALNRTFKYTNEITDLNNNHNHNHLFEGYAGCGKTTTVIQKVIPTLKDSYIILSPSHSSIEEYRSNALTCNVIQKYAYNKTIPTEQIIIVDEIGLCDEKANDTIYRCSLAGKRILSYGDYAQLYPVGKKSHLNNNDYLNYMYGKRWQMVSNYRNGFTKEYYDELINNEIDLIEELKKYRTKYFYDAECVICTTNKARPGKPNTGCEVWNKKIMDRMKIEMDDIGCKVMCKTNDLREMDIYNNFMFTVTDNDDDVITLDDKYKVPFDKFEKFFVPAYARTTYNIQGKSLKSFYIPNSELKDMNTGRIAYTVISRLKTIKSRTGMENKKKKAPINTGFKVVIEI
jgi:hypothetical protein